MDQDILTTKTVGYQQLYYLIRDAGSQALSLEGLDKAKKLIENLEEEEFNATYDEYDNNLFLFIASSSHTEILEFTLKNKQIDIHFQNQFGDNALLKAASYNRFNNVKLLLSHGAQLEEKNSNGENVFLKAVSSNCLQLVQYLIEEKKCDIYTEDNKKQNAIVYCGYWNSVEVLDYLLNNTELDINSTDEKSYNALLDAISDGGSLEVIQYLIFQTNIDLHHKTNVGDTALSLAIRWREDETVDLLIPKYFSSVDDFKNFYELPRIKIMRESNNLSENYQMHLNKISQLEQIFIEKQAIESSLSLNTDIQGKNKKLKV